MALEIYSAFEAYLADVKKNAFSEQTEHSSRAALERLLEAAATAFGPAGVSVLHEPKRAAGKGAPDFRVSHAGMILGYVENKPVGENLDKVRKSAQIKKYLELSSNILLTDYLRFIWIKDGETQEAILATQSDLESRSFHLREDRVEDVEKLLAGFFSCAPEGVGRARELAPELAKRCRLLRDHLVDELIRQEKEDETGRLYGLFEVFKKNIFADLKLKEFADAFAQTLGYGLFLAKYNAPTDETVDLYNVKRFVPRTFELIRELVDFLEALEQDRYRDIKWVIEEILSLINGLDLSALHEDLSFKSRKIRRGVRAKSEEEARLFERDPYIYFYEDFLQAYDSDTRESRGVYYTPPPVVNFIIRAVDDILVDTFDIKDGLADRERVTVLDFACGTGTFLLEVFQKVFERLGPESGKADAVVRQHLLRNIFGFEFLIAPYTIAHLKLSQYLEEKGYPLKDDERLQIYLTNTLEPIDPQYNALLPALSAETEQAQEIKQKPILVITGNPPYSGHSRNMGPNAKASIDAYKEVDGKPLGERNPKWLQDDYVKFIRFAQMKMDGFSYKFKDADGKFSEHAVNGVERGIVAVITNHSFLSNPTFRGMRQSLLRSFNQIYVLDLHGSTKPKETAPDGSSDENVFEIQKGVAITLFIKEPELKRGIWHSDLWGKQIAKYRSLANQSRKVLDWQLLEPASPFYLYIPQNRSRWTEYESGRPIRDIFPVSVLGFQTHRDHFAVAFQRKGIQARIHDLRNDDLDDTAIREKFKLKDNRDWQLRGAREELSQSKNDKTILCAYRPFDNRWCWFGYEVMDYPRREMLDHIAGRENLQLLVPRQIGTEVWRHSLTAEHPANDCLVSNASREANYSFPVWLYDEAGERCENLSDKFREWIDGRYDNHYEAEEILGCIYAVLYAQSYRDAYQEFLRIDFPRIPFPEKSNDFETLSTLGTELIDAHLMREVPARGLGAYTGKGDHLVEKRRYEPPQEDTANGKLWINKDQYFAGVPPTVWEFMIGGYQVLDKYLKDRQAAKRTLSLYEIENVENIINVLDFTIAQMAKIDAAYCAAFPDVAGKSAA